MQSPLISTHKPSFEFINLSQLADDVPSFEEAFDTESLKSFYKQQRQAYAYGRVNDMFREHAKSIDDNMFETGSLSSPDDRETQASPLVRYISKYSQANSLADSQFGVNLSQRYFNDDFDSNSMTSPTSLFELSRDPQEVLHIQSLDNIPPKPIFEVKKVTEMKGNLRMTMSFGNITLQDDAKPLQNTGHILTSHIKAMEDEDTIKLMKLVRMKKVFKIQKDLKPKTPVKNKANAKSKGKNSPTSQQGSTVLSTPTPVTTAQPVQSANATLMDNLVQAMRQKGFNNQQIMNQIMMMQNRGAPSSPSQMMSFNNNGMGQTSPSQKK